jgi:hypothetical protein
MGKGHSNYDSYHFLLSELKLNGILRETLILAREDMKMIKIMSHPKKIFGSTLCWYDWLEKHRDFGDCYNKAFTCLDEEGNLRMVQGIP